MANKKNNDMKDWQSKKTFAQICEDPMARALVIDRLKRNDCDKFAGYLCSGEAILDPLMNNMGGGIPAKPLIEIAEALDAYYSLGKAQYYWISDLELVGKRTGDYDYIYRGGYWQADMRRLISNRLHGFDSTADADDPYGYGSTDLLDSIDKITREEAMARIRKESK